MLIIIIVIALVMSLGWHSMIKNYWIACLASAVTTMALVWVVGISHIGGYFDMQFFKNMATIGSISFVVSALVGSGIKKLKLKRTS